MTQGNDMLKIVRAGSVARERAEGALYFGGEIGFTPLAVAPNGQDVDIFEVDFAPGARNCLHVHRFDQVLIGTKGSGFVGDATGNHPLGPGDVAIIPAGHPHWHGAGPEGPFSHLTVSRRGDEITIVDPDTGQDD